MKTKFKTKYDYPVYYIAWDEIHEGSMKEYLETYWNDETLTPDGLANRTQVMAILLGRNGKLLAYSKYKEYLEAEYYKEDDGWIPEIKYGTFTIKGAKGNHPFVWNRDKFNSYDEAYESILDGFYHNFKIKGTDAVYLDINDAQEALKEHLLFKEFGYFPTTSTETKNKKNEND
jgi:hypothetical protein